MSRALRPFIASAVAISATCTIAALVLLAASFDLVLPPSWGFRGFPAIIAVTFTWTAANLAWRRPRNAVGWLLLWVGFVAAVQVLCIEYSIAGVAYGAEQLPGAIFAGWFASWIWLTEVTLVAVYLLQLFPDGHFLSARWRGVAWFGAGGAVVAAFVMAFKAGPLNNAPFVGANPYALFDDSSLSFFYYGMGGLALAGAGSAASLFVRYRRSRGVERQQLKWLAFEAIVLAIAVVIGSVFQTYVWASAFMIGTIALAPIMVAVAVFRYHLYEIDSVINRALVYGATSAHRARVLCRHRRAANDPPAAHQRLRDRGRDLDSRECRACPAAPRTGPGLRRPSVLPVALQRREYARCVRCAAPGRSRPRRGPVGSGSSGPGHGPTDTRFALAAFGVTTPAHWPSAVTIPGRARATKEAGC